MDKVKPRQTVDLPRIAGFPRDPQERTNTDVKTKGVARKTLPSGGRRGGEAKVPAQQDRLPSKRAQCNQEKDRQRSVKKGEPPRIPNLAEDAGEPSLPHPKKKETSHWIERGYSAFITGLNIRSLGTSTATDR